MGIYELLNDSTVQRLLISLGASICRDFLKGTAKWILKVERTDFDQAVDETIAHFSKGTIESIEILPEYFTKMFDDPDVHGEIAEFESGSRDISLAKLGESFIKAGFYYPTHQTQKAEGIVSYFLSALTRKILFDSSRGPVLLYDTIQLLGKQAHDHARITIETIHRIQGSIEPKLNEIIRGNSDLQSTVQQGINVILKAVESSTVAGDGAQSPEFKLAIKLHDEGRVLLARQLYVEILDMKPTNIEVLWKLNTNIGKTYLNSGEDEKGIPYFEQAYHYFPEEEKGKVQLVFARLVGNRLDEGLAITQEILDANPKCVDAVVLAANIFVRQGSQASKERARQLFTPEVLETHVSLYTFAWVLRNLGELEEAEKHYRKSMEKERHPQCLFELAVCILEPIVQKMGPENPGFKSIDQENQVRLNESLTLFNEAIELFKSREEPLELAHAFLNRSVAQSFLNNIDESYSDCVEAEKLGLNVAPLFRNKGIALVMLDKADLAAVEFRKAVGLGDEASVLYLIRTLMQSDQVVEARKVVLELISYPEISLTEENLEFYLILSEILERELNTDGADEIIRLAKLKYPNDGEVIIRTANLTRSRHGSKNAIDIILEAIPLVTKKKSILELTLADLYFLSDMWGEALEIYRKFARDDEYNLPVQRIVICLFNLGRHADCLQSIHKVKGDLSPQKLLRELEARIYFHAEAFAAASNLYKDLAVNYKNYVHWGHCEFRLAHHDEAKRILESASRKFDNLSDLIQISAAFNVIGETKNAVELAYRAASALPENSDAALNFFWIFNQHTKLNPGEGNVTDDQIHMYQDIGENFEERFPGVPGLKKVSLPKIAEQMSADDFTKMFREVIPEDEYFRKREQFYLSHRLPVSVFSSMVGRDMIGTWGGIIANPDYSLWAYNPQAFPRERANVIAKTIVAEPISILTLHTLNHLNLLDRLFEKVLVPQRFLDTVQELITRERLSATEGSTVVILVGDSFRILKTSPEDVVRRLTSLRELKDYLTDRVIGFPIVDDSSRRTKLGVFLKQETIQAVEQSIVLGVPLLSDEATLPLVLNDELKFRTISTYTILTYALAKKLLTKREFNKAVLDLIAANYHYVPVDPGIIIQGLEEANFVDTYRSKAAFRSIAHPDSDPILDAIVIAGFLGMLFGAPASEVTKGYWFDYALDCIPKIRYDPTILLRKIITHLDEQLPLATFPKGEILGWVESRLRAWAKKRGITFRQS